MTRHFDDLGALAVHLASAAVAVPLALEAGLEAVARRIEATAKAEIGTYQPAVGGFPAWPELAESTKADRLAKGYTEDDPLLRSGDLQAAITHEVRLATLEAIIGVPEGSPQADIAVYHEVGTSKMPARPVLGPAAFRNKAVIEKLVGAALVSGLVASDATTGLSSALFHSSPGYDLNVG